METQIHLFWECPKVKPLWREFVRFCKLYVDKNADYCRNNCVLLGFGTPVLNCLSTQLKYHIHIARLFDLPLSFTRYIKRIQSIRTIEFLVGKYMPHLKLAKTHKYWGKLGDNAPFEAFLND